MMWHAHDGMGWWMVFGGVLWLLFWGSIVWLIVGGRFQGERHPPPREPLDIARERYARGEIDRSTFEQLLRDLNQTPSSRS
jgi:putative membrane protein